MWYIVLYWEYFILGGGRGGLIFGGGDSSTGKAKRLDKMCKPCEGSQREFVGVILGLYGNNGKENGTPRSL